ncbi:MAG TPA: polyprenyl synthetase family protein [Streptosporangiaceae bacterium]|nr:polyprenyl synthetase family protein [Streptosporangiaceae bacterium]
MAKSVTPAAQAARLRLVESVEQRLSEFLSYERARWSAVDERAAVPVDAIADLVHAGGKRLRPAFCVSGYLAAGGDPANRVIVDVAAGLELVHVAALIHDDVVDDSPLRRAAPTVHTRHIADHAERGLRGEPRRYGEGVAILSGDLADVYADRLAAGLSPRARAVWGELRTEIMIGQFLDVAIAAESVADPELSRWIAICKSGRYSIHRPLVLGAAVAGRHDLAAAFEEYGTALGEAFQLRDDLIDFGDSTTTGKPAGLDLEQHKMTLLLVRAAQRDPRVRERLRRRDWDPAELRGLLDEIDAAADIERYIGELTERAQESIAHAPIDQQWRDELAALAITVAYRDR